MVCNVCFQDNHDACVSAFTMQLLACFESSAYKELRVDLEKYNGIMDLFSFNIEVYHLEAFVAVD